MSGKDLFEGMSYVDERFVDEAENKAYPKRVATSMKMLAAPPRRLPPTWWPLGI